MRIKITLNKPKDRIIELVNFAAKDLGSTNGLEIHIKNSKRCFRGRGGYRRNGIVKMAKTSRYCATACIGPDQFFPMDYQDCILKNWEDALIWVAAHELFHCIQFRENLSHGEKAAVLYATEILKEWQTPRQITEDRGRDDTCNHESRNPFK